MSDKRWYLISYDIRHPKRWRNVYRQLQGRGERIQYSLFRARLTRRQVEELRWELERLLAKEDDLMFVHLCPQCAERVRQRGKRIPWDGSPRRFDII
jgi:CRISPR-associated protein Cas2